MRFALTHKIITFALVASASVPILISQELGFVFVLAFIALAVAGWWIEPPLTRYKRFRYGATALVSAVLLLQLARFMNGEPMAKLGMEFALILLGAKMCSRGFASDYHQIVILSFIHIIAATVVMDDLFYAGSFLVFVCLSPPILALSYLRKEMERRFGEDAGEDGPKMLERLLGSKRIVSAKFLAGSSLLSLPVLIITGILFITFPRVGFGLLGRLSNNEAMAGFGNEIALNDFDLVRKDNAVLMRLEPLASHKDPPERLPWRFRGAVFDIYEKDTWKRSTETRWEAIPHRGGVYSLDDSHGYHSKKQGFEVLLESMEPPLLFVPEGTGQIVTYPVAVGGRPMPRILERNLLGAIRYQDNAQVGLRYRVYLNGAAPHGPRPANELSYLQLPKKSERLVALARTLATGESETHRAMALVNGLAKNYRYSTKLSRDEANLVEDNPLNRFLFSRKTGNCTHFATALTLMLRAVGIPARTVSGFSGAEWNAIGGYYAVYKRSAHSWTEAFLDEKWVSLDATPQSTDPTIEWRASALAMFVDMLRMNWHKHVVSYDTDSQFKIAMGLRSIWLENVRSSRGLSHISFRWPLLVLLCGALTAWLLIWVRKRRHRFTSGGNKRFKRHNEQATQLYRYLERRLSRLGHPRPSSMTPNEHVRALKREAPGLYAIAEQITDRYNEIRFGGSSFLQNEQKRLKARIRSLDHSR